MGVKQISNVVDVNLQGIGLEDVLVLEGDFNQRGFTQLRREHFEIQFGGVGKQSKEGTGTGGQGTEGVESDGGLGDVLCDKGHDEKLRDEVEDERELSQW